MPSLVTLLLFVFELSSKNHRGGGAKMTPPPTRAKVKRKVAALIERRRNIIRRFKQCPLKMSWDCLTKMMSPNAHNTNDDDDQCDQCRRKPSRVEPFTGKILRPTPLRSTLFGQIHIHPYPDFLVENFPFPPISVNFV